MTNLSKMPDEQLDIMVLTICGWRRHTKRDGSEHWVNNNDDRAIIYPFEALPKYTTDLNAMHEAEKYHLIYPSTFCKKLWVLMFGDNGDHDQHRSNYAGHIISTTARQRAEAFVLTMYKT